MRAGLPVLASINFDNDLVDLIQETRVGRVSEADNGTDLPKLVEEMLTIELNDADISDRCKAVASELFSTESAVGQIVAGLT